MFYELIYTRCRQGMDITQKGRQISSDGYKVYSCTPALMEEGEVDLPFFANVTLTKPPFIDPGFMDDAYLFYVPDIGKSFFINSHPIPFDQNAPGDYAHRPGNFVNHALVGDYSKIYPYKMFQDDSIWNAKTKGEAYFYENPPAETGLPSRDISNPPGKYKFEEIGAFIKDGREEALKKAVAFLIAQYNEEPEKRKFLVIKDDSSRNIELWIAAIECAFSPQIASVIPFATRMDKFTNVNRYTVKNGVYQQQMNLQDPNHKQRYRAMIVGVDERDKANIGASRPIANSPFVLLDGKLKQIDFECDIKNSYYQLITKFDDEHKKFCEEFLQTFTVLKPSAEIYDLYSAFIALNSSSLPDTRTLSNALDTLNKFKAANNDIFKDIYKRVRTEASRFMKEDFSYALNIINWLLTASEVVGDASVKQFLTENVCKEFTSIIFSKTDNAKKRSYWTQVQRTGFKMDVARVITDMRVIKDNLSNSSAFASADAVVFVAIYLDACSLLGNIDQSNLGSILKFGINVCYRNNDTDSFHEIVSTLSRVKNIDNQNLLFAIAKGNDKKFGEFVINYLIDHDNAILASDNSTLEFCKKLKDESLENLAGSALAKRVNKLDKPSDIDRFINSVLNSKSIKIEEESLAKVFEAVDAKIEAPNDKFADFIQTRKPQDAKCLNSAHVFALNVFANIKKYQDLKEILTDLAGQGFPSSKDEKYIDKLTEYIIKASLTDEEQLTILKFLFNAPVYFSTYLKKIVLSAAKYKDKWDNMIKAFSGIKNNKQQEQVEDSIVQAFADSKQNEKSLVALGKLLTDEKSQEYFKSLVDKFKEKK